MQSISSLPYYVLFVFKDIQNDIVYSTTDINTLKEFTQSESLIIGNSISFLDGDYTIKDVSLLKIGTTLNNDYKYGFTTKGVIPEGTVKDSLFRVDVIIEQQQLS